jgi:RNA polymerase sigma-70 factor (ECF subfamily)
MLTSISAGEARPDDPEAELARARQGSRSSLGRLLARVEPGLRKRAARDCRGRLGARVAPSELVQATLARAAADFSICASDRFGGFVEWVQAIQAEQVRKSRRIWRARQRAGARREPQAEPSAAPRALVDAAAPSPSADARRHELGDALVAAVGRLSPPQRLVIELVYREGLTHAEAARRLGTSVKAVEHRVRDAKDRLRTLLGRYRDGL